ncbi:MAG TPA: ABC transporter ATP-binding protein [Anaerolinea thermolimosa]|uniref:ABC transporter ATP-binding protein n=1 Tax=Anaerolinea thermolimosa TaxID=229919 RepID=A0A3D1JF62_9CHLR|nr:ABC transporter ATP-binding protein [Anaerolinea thermolimosa]GAP07752.1 ABC-type antimicrobial peptide transport system, ATPase component [Anaerolinea thermolimosa]HCE16398.1 ABC transporter ATP-binding protein [Anaerolinea thermolimosa]
MMTDVEAPATTWVIEAEDLWRIYRTGTREVYALRGVNLQIPLGRFIALKGRSGSGKTTLLNCLGGLDRPDRGVVRIFGRDLSQLSEKELTQWRRKEVGFIFQSFGLLPTLSAYENIELMLRIAQASRKEKKQRTIELLEMVGLAKWMHHRPFELSGGQQQRVAIARALANRPRLILADEPTGELDSTTAREILSLFRQIVEEEKITVLMSSHDPLVDGYVDEILPMKDGQIVRER